MREILSAISTLILVAAVAILINRNRKKKDIESKRSDGFNG